MRRVPSVLVAAALVAAFPLAAESPGAVGGCLQERFASVGVNDLAIDADGDRVAFISADDPLGTNPGGLPQVFLWREGLGFAHARRTNMALDLSIDAAGRRIAFVSPSPNEPGRNRHGQLQVFVWSATDGTRQITDHRLDEVFESSLDNSGTRIAFLRPVVEDPHGLPIRDDLVLWEEGVGERVLVVGEEAVGLPRERLQFPAISGDGRRVVFVATPGVPEPPIHIRIWDEDTGSEESVVELAFRDFRGLDRPSVDRDGDRFVFSARVDPLGSNPGGGSEVFLWDEAEGLRQLTGVGPGDSFGPSISDDGRAVAFLSTADPFGSNPDGVSQVFLWRERPDGTAAFTQVTAWRPGPHPEHPGGSFNAALSGDGRRIAHWRLHHASSEAAADGVSEVWISDCAAPAPPFGDWIESPDLPGFDVQVRIDGDRQGVQEPVCIEETLCVSGAVPGRSEVFVRVVGPKPNGRLWPTLVKFSTSEVEVWIRQTASGEVEYYRLRGARPGFDELPGLFDREGFAPTG